MRSISGAVASIALLLAVFASNVEIAGAQQAPVDGREMADLVVVNATIYTMDSARPRAEAMAIVDGRIAGVGDTRSILEAYRPEETIDAGGRTVIPGLIDAHAHVMGLGAALRTLDLVGTESAEEIAERVAAAVAERDPGEWILGRGWDQNDWERKVFPNREILDRVAPDNPVWLTRIDGHAGWANSRAMDAAGIDATTPDPEGGRVVRGEDGEPTGVFVDNAETLVTRAIPEPDAEELSARLAAAQEHMASVGLTGVHDMGAGPTTVMLYGTWAEEGRLVPRIAVYLSAGEPVEWWAREGAASTPETDRLKVAGAKIYADGALGSRGAALLEPYSDDPDNRGLLVTDPDVLAEQTARAVELGLQPAIHAIGDRGNRVALDAIEHAWREEVAEGTAAYGTDPAPGYAGWTGPAPRIEHVQVVATEDIPRFVELGVIASFQPTHATSDMYWAEDRVGPERIEGAYAWRTFMDAGARLACGSDFPVERANPFHGLYAAVTRQDQEGWPEGGWRPSERMTREEALACFTREAAAAAGMDHEVGTLSPGKRADFLILDADPTTVPAEEIWRVGVDRTVIGGETVHRAGEGRSR